MAEKFDKVLILMSTEITEGFKVPKGFEKVLLIMAAMKLQAWYEGTKVVKIRNQVFNQEFMEKNFGEIHKSEIGQPIPPMGYPDMGSGVYSQKLSYKDWYRFNIAQRIHQNHLETMGLATTSVLAAGLVCPCLAIGLGTVHVLGRFFYGLFYESKGAGSVGRKIAIGLTYLANLVGLGLFIKKFFIDK